jgi:hypothetical protein
MPQNVAPNGPKWLNVGKIRVFCERTVGAILIFFTVVLLLQHPNTKAQLRKTRFVISEIPQL